MIDIKDAKSSKNTKFDARKISAVTLAEFTLVGPKPRKHTL
jgi:hypothetical protein